MATAVAVVFFLSAPLMVLSFWALAGIFTRSDTVRCVTALAWFAIALSMSVYNDADVAMITVMVFLPAAFAFSFRAVGMYRTEDLLKPQASVQAAALAALCFIPVVASEPQLLLPLMLSFLVFLMLVRSHRTTLLLIPLPAAFVCAPTLVNAVRYAGAGTWRQIFGNVMLPSSAHDGRPMIVNLSDIVSRAFGVTLSGEAWQYAAVAILALIVLLAAVSLTGCSLLKVAVATGDPLSKEEMNVRTMTRGFYYDMAAEVARTADSIAQAAPDVATRVAAVRWKIRATRAGVSAAMQGIPDVALADMWILCRRMNEGFAAAPDSLLFGAQSGMARDAAARLDRRAARLARQVLAEERYGLMERFVAQYVRDNPSEEGMEAANTTLAWIEFLRENGVEHAYATGSIAEVLADVNDRVSSQTQQLASSVGWSKDILEMQLQQDSLRMEVGARLDSLERSFTRIVVVAEHLPEISDRVLDELNKQVTQLIYTMNYSVDNAFADFDRQRDELQRYVTGERQALVEQLRQTAGEVVRTTLDAVPGLVGKVLLYVVSALAVLIGGPFALGFWLGGVRARAGAKRKE